jgi:hypothetical protein
MKKIVRRNEQTFAPELDAWQRGEPLHRVARRTVGKKRTEQGLSYTADDGARFERALRNRIGDRTNACERQRFAQPMSS